MAAKTESSTKTQTSTGNQLPDRIRLQPKQTNADGDPHCCSENGGGKDPHSQN